MKEPDTPDRPPLDDILEQQDVDELLRVLDAGANVNELTAWGSLLKRVILAFEAHPRLHELVVELIRPEPTRGFSPTTWAARCSRR
jgi:hypothetical protein